MKCSLGISNFLEEIYSLSHSVVFLYFFALIAEEGFLIFSCYSLELCIQMLISFLCSFAFITVYFLLLISQSQASISTPAIFHYIFIIGFLSSNTVGNAHSVWATLSLPLLKVCAFPVALPGNCLKQVLGCVHFPGLSHSGSGSRVVDKGTDSVGSVFCVLPSFEQLRRPRAW